MKVHVNRFALFVRTRKLQGKRDAALIEVSIKSRSMGEGSDVKFIRILHRNFGLIANRLGHITLRSLLRLVESQKTSVQN
jgi:hypothetical protein